MAKKEREKAFRVVPHPKEPGLFLVVDRDGNPICPAVARRGRPVFEMRAGRLRPLHMAYVEDESNDEDARGEFWIRQEYAHRVPVW